MSPTYQITYWYDHNLIINAAVGVLKGKDAEGPWTKEGPKGGINLTENKGMGIA